jgi:hypothetical protein
MIFKPFCRDDTGCAAYVFGCGGCGVGAAVDSQERDVEACAEFARLKGVRITHVIDAHVPADPPTRSALLPRSGSSLP